MPSSTATFDKRVFSIEVIKKALYRFADKGGFELRESGDSILVTVFAETSAAEDIAGLLNSIRNEVIDQDLRRIVAAETTTLRTLILANAFSQTDLIEA